MQNLYKAILEISIYSSAMILSVFCIGKLFSHKTGVKLMHALWLIVLIRLLLPVTLESPVNIPGNILSGLWDNESSAKMDMSPAAGISSVQDGIQALGSLPRYESSPEDKTPGTPAIRLDFGALALTLWVMAAAIILIANLYKIIICGQRFRSSATGNNLYQAKLEYAKRLLGIKKNVSIAESVYADIPFVYGYFKPVILLPPGLSKAIGDQKLSYVILHELCHIKRNDLLLNYIWILARALHWFNPLVYIAYKNYLDSVEECCDEVVAGYLDIEGKCEYTQSLLDVARLSKNAYKSPLSAYYGSSKTSIGRRVKKMMQPQKKSKLAILTVMLTVCVLLFTCFTTACQPKETSSNPLPVQNDDSPVVVEDSRTAEGQMSEEDAKELITSLNLSAVDSIQLLKREPYFGNTIAFFDCNDPTASTIYAFLGSGQSLVSYENKAVDMTVPMQLTEDELYSIAMDYVQRVWQSDSVIITMLGSSILGPDGTVIYYTMEGTMNDNGRPFDVNLNGNGELWCMTSYPQDVDLSKGVPIEQARQTALELIRQEAHITDPTRLTLISEEVTNESYAPMYIFNYEYRADNPSETEYDYDCMVKVVVATGETMGIEIEPVTSNISVITIEEAEQMAKEYVAEEKNLDISKIITTLSYDNTMNGQIMYNFEFNYNDSYIYTLSMTAAGEFWDIGEGPAE